MFTLSPGNIGIYASNLLCVKFDIVIAQLVNVLVGVLCRLFRFSSSQ
jgi:hypothetical protein